MAKQREDEIVVYWGPCYQAGPQESLDWNIFYEEPVEFLPEIKQKRDKDAKQQSIVYCPAFNGAYKNMFYIKNVVDSRFTFNHETGGWDVPGKFQIHPAMEMRPPYIQNRKPLILGMAWLFACEESLEMEVIAPFMHKTEASRYGVVATGKFDIGSWYRPIHADYLLWEEVDRLHIPEGEPFFYLRFNTDKKVVLKRFADNGEIYKHSVSNVQTKYLFGKLPPLEKLYHYFSKTRTKDIMIQKIKAAVIE